MDIEGLIFDFGGVIWNMRWDACQELEQAYGLPRGAVFRTLYRTEAWREVERGRGDRQAWLDGAHRALEELAGRPLPRLHELWRERQHLLSENVALIRALRPLYRTAILSNADISLRARIERDLGLQDLFDAIICSAEAGMAKPDLAIYRLAADLLALPTDACLFVDDYEPNIKAAEEAGMRALLYRVDQGHDLRAQLAELGVTARED
ncbi:MAG: HAD family phosphatase [Candidatus Rokubacteria bacterium]|nr:HAD family phosphatase [Candidatus Rokubacteria bacterium]MBI2555590.1 HAD family phosphatase [Candidatus Rokubacteria bacterium]